MSVCQHLSRTAPLLDRGVIIRSLHHNVFDEPAAATNMLYAGRATSGTVIYPSIGSIVSHELGPRGEGVPAYVVMGYPNVTRGHCALGINPAKELFDGDRPVPITDRGEPIRELFG